MDVEDMRGAKEARLLNGLGLHLAEWTQSRHRTEISVNYVESSNLHSLRDDLKTRVLRRERETCRSRRMLMLRVAT